jgi:hypothetical protein
LTNGLQKISDTPIEIYHPSKMERRTDIHSLDYCQQAMGKELTKMTTKSMEICSKSHKDAQELIRGCQLPPLAELGKNLVMEELIDKIQDNTNQRREIIRKLVK